MIFQQAAAENKAVKGNIKYKPYWDEAEFIAVYTVMDAMFKELSWSK